MVNMSNLVVQPDSCKQIFCSPKNVSILTHKMYNKTFNKISKLEIFAWMITRNYDPYTLEQILKPRTFQHAFLTRSTLSSPQAASAPSPGSRQPAPATPSAKPYQPAPGGPGILPGSGATSRQGKMQKSNWGIISYLAWKMFNIAVRKYMFVTENISLRRCF